jgi:signal transduction histidine kinase
MSHLAVSHLDADPPRTLSGPADTDRALLIELLDERVRFENLLARLSTTFINLPADQVDGQIERGLRQIVEFLKIERSTVAQFSADGSRLLVTHSYTIPGFEPFPLIDLAPLLPWYTGKLRAGEVLRFTRVPEDVPPEAPREREFCQGHNVPRSHLALPFRVGDDVLGSLGFGSFRREVSWPDALVQGLQLVGEIFANALARKRTDDALRQHRERQKQADLELQRQREHLAHVGRLMAMGELAASIAHEVNQPLCAIVSNAQAVHRMLGVGGYDIDELREALQDIAEDGQRASAVIAHTRAFLRKAPAERAAVNLNEVVREVAALARTKVTRHSAEVRFELANALPLVLGDRVQLQQVMLNLLTNGVEAMDCSTADHRVLVVSSAAGAHDVTVAFRDTGHGISAAHGDRLFEAFFTTKAGSMGMGLAICKSIITAHGGTIGAHRNSAGGATFEFTLPAWREAQ